MLQPGKRCTTNGRKYCVCVLVDQRFEVRTPEIRNREFVENSVAADRGEDKLLRCLTETLFQNRWRGFDLKEEKGLMLSRNFCIVLEKSPEALSGYIIFLDVDDHVLRVCVDGCLVLVARQSNRGGKSCSRRTGRGMRHSGLEYCTDGLAESFERFLSGKLRQVFCLTVERSLLGKISRSAPVLSKKMLQRTLAQFLGNKENLIGLTTLIREETLAELVGKTECGSSHNPKLCRWWRRDRSGMDPANYSVTSALYSEDRRTGLNFSTQSFSGGRPEIRVIPCDEKVRGPTSAWSGDDDDGVRKYIVGVWIGAGSQVAIFRKRTSGRREVGASHTWALFLSPQGRWWG